MDHATVRPGFVLNGRFRVVAELGAGGMGTVFKAIDARSRSPVAIKVLHRHFSASPETLRRFSREVAATSGLASPHVARSLWAGRQGRDRFIVMEFAEGQTLRAILNERRQLPANEALFIAYQVAGALEAAHKQGIIHRDIKPENIILGSNRLARVVDFGIARAADDLASAASGGVFGTAEYLAPEVSEGTWDERADIYSLGVTFFEMLTGVVPFRGSTPWQVEVSRGAGATLSEDQCSKLPPGLVNLVRRLLSRNPDERPRTARDVRTAIEHLAPNVAAEVPSVAPDEQTPRHTVSAIAGHFAAHRMVVGAGFASLILLSASGVVLAGKVRSSDSQGGNVAVAAATPSPAATQPSASGYRATASTAGAPTATPIAGPSATSAVPSATSTETPAPQTPLPDPSVPVVTVSEVSAPATTPSAAAIAPKPSRTPTSPSPTPQPSPTESPALRAVHTFPPLGSPLEQGALVSIRAEFEPGRADSIFIEWADDHCVGQSATYAVTPSQVEQEFSSIYSGNALPKLSRVTVRLFNGGVTIADQTLGSC